jgi:hypothetical protein
VHPTLSAGVSAVGQTQLDMGGIDTMYADSYDSSEQPYDASDADEDATVQTTNEFKLTAGGGGNTESIEIRGDLIAESYNIPPGQEDKLTVTGERRTDDSLDPADPISGAITERMNRIRDADLESNGTVVSGGDHDDGGVWTIDEDTYVNGTVSVSNGSTLRIEDGATVHVDGGLDVSEDGSRVEFVDQADGDDDVAVLVEGDLAMRDQSELRAEGGNRNELFVDGAVEVRNDAAVTTADDTRFELYNTGDVDVTDEVRIAADGDVAKNLWLYSSGDDVYFGGKQTDGIDFAGVMYAPTSDVVLKNEMTFKGSFTSGSFAFDDADLSLHYDESLATLQPFQGAPVPVVSHLHVSRHRVTVEDD